MSWLRADPNDISSTRSAMQTGMRAGSAFGPLGMALGALSGWMYDRHQSGRLQQMGNNLIGKQNDRLAATNDFSLNDSSPLAQFDDMGRGQASPTSNPNSVLPDLGITDWSDQPGLGGNYGGGNEGRDGGGNAGNSGSSPGGNSMSGWNGASTNMMTDFAAPNNGSWEQHEGIQRFVKGPDGGRSK